MCSLYSVLHGQPTFSTVFILYAQSILNYCLRYCLTKRTTYNTSTIRFNAILCGYSTFRSAYIICTLRWLITVQNLLSIYSLFPRVTHILQICQMDFLHYFYPQHYLRSVWMAYFFYIIFILYAQLILNYSLH